MPNRLNRRYFHHKAKANMKLGTKLFVVITVLGFAGVLPLIVHWNSTHQTDADITGTATHRTVIVIDASAPITSSVVRDRLCGSFAHCQNGRNGIDIGMLKSGVMPRRPVTAIVETDENCTPDTYGISHCTNALQLPDGSTLVLRHDHNMQAYPCLKPGEVVTLEGQASA